MLLKKKEINNLNIYTQKKGYTLIPIKLFWLKSWCKIQIGVVKGKSLRDKRLDKKNDSWKKEKNTIFKRLSLKKIN